MDTVAKYREIIRETLSGHARIPYLKKSMTKQAVFDDTNDRYLVVAIGWDGDRRVHGCVIHVDIIDGKVWVQMDNTDSAVARELEAAGIPRSEIVLGFHEPGIRQHTGYAVA